MLSCDSAYLDFHFKKNVYEVANLSVYPKIQKSSMRNSSLIKSLKEIELVFNSPVPSTRRAVAVTSVVRVPITLRQSFICKFFRKYYAYCQILSYKTMYIFVYVFLLRNEILFKSSFFQKFISQQPLIRKHSYLDHRYPEGPAFIPWLLIPGTMPRGGAKGQNLGHL